MQLAGELSKVNLASLIRLVRNGELTGKICLTQGVNTAYLFFAEGELFHVESDVGEGKDALLELFLWQSGTFSYIECSVENTPISIGEDEHLELIVKEGLSYQEARRYLEQMRISFRTIFQSIVPAQANAFLAAMDGQTPLGDIVAQLRLSKSEYIPQLRQILEDGHAIVIEPPTVSEQINLPDWVISRLKQDNPDPSQAIVDLVIWTDRIKCWLYQADADLTRLISSVDGRGLSVNATAENTAKAGPGAATPTNEQSFSPIQDEEDEDDMGTTSATMDGASVDNQTQGSDRQASSVRPPGYEF
ncbi:MAG: DUF4388 domain-containing protein [Candidatus Obscuribacterales bacterium]|jgi:hypothetical protein|nr:DUF4388 domain-containing protein [Candidatus Obscuribacterales bacterium]